MNARARISIEPKLDARIWSLAGFWTSVDPGYETNLTSNGALTFYPQNGSIDSSAFLTATLSRGFNMYLRAGFSVLGLDDLPEFGPKPLITAAPSTYTFESTTQQAPLAFVSPTAAQTLRLPLGSSFTLHSEARGFTSPISYRWYQNGRLLPNGVAVGERRRTGRFLNCGGGDQAEPGLFDGAVDADRGVGSCPE